MEYLKLPASNTQTMVICERFQTKIMSQHKAKFVKVRIFFHEPISFPEHLLIIQEAW